MGLTSLIPVTRGNDCEALSDVTYKGTVKIRIISIIIIVTFLCSKRDLFPHSNGTFLQNGGGVFKHWLSFVYTWEKVSTSLKLGLYSQFLFSGSYV